MKKIKKIILNHRELEYIFRRNKLSKHLKLSVRSDASVLVSVPLRMSERRVELFVKEKGEWLLARVDFFQKQNDKKLIKTTPADYLGQRGKARKLILQRIEKINAFYKFKYGRISIRNQKTRWGSCSRQGNLNFNYRLIYLSEKLFDYVIVHELCHLKEMNHSSRFWNLVAKKLPDYKTLRRELKKEGLLLF